MSAPSTVRLDPEVLEALDQLAHRAGRSRSWLVSRAVHDYLAMSAWRKIDTGLQEADAGEFASDDQVSRVRAWFADQG